MFLQTGGHRRSISATGRNVSPATSARRSSSGFGATESIASRRIRRTPCPRSSCMAWNLRDWKRWTTEGRMVERKQPGSMVRAVPRDERDYGRPSSACGSHTVWQDRCRQPLIRSVASCARALSQAMSLASLAEGCWITGVPGDAVFPAGRSHTVRLLRRVRQIRLLPDANTPSDSTYWLYRRDDRAPRCAVCPRSCAKESIMGEQTRFIFEVFPGPNSACSGPIPG
jgi:hypothetical protein